MKITFDPVTKTQSTVVDRRWIQNSSTNMVYLYGVDSGWIIRATFTRNDKFKIANMIGVYDLDPDDEYCYVIHVPVEAAAVPGGLGVSLILYEPVGEDYVQHATIATAGYLYENDSVVTPLGMEDAVQVALELAISNLATNKIETSAIVGGSGETINKTTPIYSKIKADGVFETKVDASSHKSNVSNPHAVTKTQVGLGNADNTSDVDKPVSIAQQTELDKKANLDEMNTFTQPNTFDNDVTMKEDLTFVGSKKITGLGAGVDDGDSVNKKQMDDADDAVKQYVDNHDDDSGAHEFILGLIGDIDQEISRLDGRGRSYGEIDYLTATLVAMETAARNTAINAAIVLGFGGAEYAPSNGDLVYDAGVGSGVNYHEWEFNGTNWVDNGAISSPKANGTTFGTVNGTGDYVTIAAGIITVILAQNATYLKDVGTASKYTYQQIYDALAARYTKDESDGLLDALDAKIESLRIAFGLEESNVGTLGHEDSIEVGDVEDFDFLLLELIAVDGSRIIGSSVIKPSTFTTNGSFIQVNSWNVAEQVVYAKLVLVEGTPDELVLEVSDETSTVRITGYKPSQVIADTIAVDHSGTNYLDESITINDDVETLDEELKKVADAIADVVSGTTDIAIDEEAITAETVREAILEVNTKAVANAEDIAEAQADIVETKTNIGLHEKRIDTLEEDLRKDNGDTSTEDGTSVISLPHNVIGNLKPQIDGLTLQAKQLIANKGNPFVNTTGWNSVASTHAIENDMMVVTANGTDRIPYVRSNTNPIVIGNKTYYYATVRALNDSVDRLRVFDGSVLMYGYVDNPVQNQWYNLSEVITATGTNLHVHAVYANAGTASGKQFEIKVAYSFNIATLIANKQYSPLYDKTFDVMDESEIKAQMDAWVADGTLPNDDILSVAGNKKLVSTNEAETETSEMYIQAPKLNSIGELADKIDIVNGKLIHTQKVGTADVTGVVAVNTTNYPLAKDASVFINYLDAGGSETGVVGTDSTSGNGTLHYELATPVPTELFADGKLQGFSKGTVDIYDNILPDIDIYSDKADVTDTDYPIATLKKVVKVGSGTTPNVELAVESAVIAGNKLSFTHTGLTAGDMVFFEYEYTDADVVKGLTTVTHFSNPLIVIDSGDAKVYKIKFSIANGTITVGKEEIV